MSDAGPRPTVRVVVADDQPLVRAGLSTMLATEPGIEVVGQAADGVVAVELARALRPDVVCMDIRMPGKDGITATRELCGPDVADPIPVLILTTFDVDEYLFGALEAGASAFVPKDAPADDVIAAARHAAVSPRAFTASDLAGAMQRRLSPTGPQLSPREKEVLGLLADGLGVAGISKQLFISESTTKTHISKVYEKLGAANRAQALMTAMRLGLIANPADSAF